MNYKSYESCLDFSVHLGNQCYQNAVASVMAHGAIVKALTFARRYHHR